jgi:signal transduction histidine kinase
MAVKSQFTTHAGGIYDSYVQWRLLRLAIPALSVFFLTGIILLIISSIKRGSRKEFSRKLAYYSGKVWLEVKILLSLFAFILLSVIGNFSTGIIACAIVFWWAYLMLIDLFTNRTRFFTNNSITWILRIYRSYEEKKPFQKGMLMRFLLLTGIEAVLIFFTFVSALSVSFPFAFLFIGLGIYLFYRYLKEYTGLVTDIGKVVDHTVLIRNGDLNTKLILSENSPMHKTAEDLSNIQEGVFTAVQEHLKSERMKIELITNVSHDLKTPLTSIVNYIDLLGRENLSPEHANDYVKVLSRKAARLTALTQDIFDISKAHSGNLELNIERIDIVELIKQSIAELDEKIQESTLNFKTTLPQDKIYISADGRKLYRVFDNLISNILKYSLENTRVYIDLTENEESVSLSFKNIASYELNMSAGDLTERFVRGEESRTTEGSGLGLAIVQSFVTLCGGSFDINIDGDLFKAVVKFKKA